MGRIREMIPDCAVSSDFIVGFCGETDASFQKTSRCSLQECRFKNSFIFKYSPRPGTKAHDLYADDVPENVKKWRNNQLLDLQNEISAEDNAEFIGRTLQVLVEGPSKKAGAFLPGTAEGTPDGSALPGWHDGASVAAEPALVALEVPADGPATPTRMQLVGRSKCDRIVVFDGNPRLAGTLADVTIDDCTTTTLMGSIVTKQLQHGSSDLLPILC